MTDLTLAIWHGYLLGATGSNIYTHELVDSWVRAGHDVVLACQEPDPTVHPKIHDVVRLGYREVDGADELVVASRDTIRAPGPGEGRCTMVVPDIHGLLPVYVLDRYEGFEVRRLIDLTPGERALYAQAQAAAMHWVLGEFHPDGVLINHATPLPAAIGPVLDAAGVPYAVKVHGSELEYALVEDASLVPAAADALARASAVLVGSDHIARRTAELLGDDCLVNRVATVPPGVDLDRFQPIPPGASPVAQLHRLADDLDARSEASPGGRDAAQVESRIRALIESGAPEQLIDGLAALHGSYAERLVEPSAGTQLRAIAPDARVFTFVGKLIPQKGAHLVLAALPAILDAHPDAHLVMAGFGPLRDALAALVIAMELGDIESIEALAAGAGTLTGEGSGGLDDLAATIQVLQARGELERWLARCGELRITERISWTGLVDHAILADLWPACETSLVPSVLAEAFGMVAAEAAACGCVPLVSDHSGLADAAAVIELGDVAPVRMAFDDPVQRVDAVARGVNSRLSLAGDERARQAAQARDNVAAVWSWDALAEQVADLMCGIREPATAPPHSRNRR